MASVMSVEDINPGKMGHNGDARGRCIDDRLEEARIAWADLDPGERRLGSDLDNNADGSSVSSEDDEDADNEVTAEIGALRRRRAYIIAQLYNVGKSIRTTEAEVLTGQDLPEIPRRDLAPKDTVDESDTASFIHAVDWRAGTDDGPGPKPLTDRAAERAGALLRLFDADGDGCLTFEEFRAYLVRLGRDKGPLGERLATDREFWLSFVLDQAGPPSKRPGGATFAPDGCRLTEAGFVGHRRMVELEHPLELDLLEMDIDVMPECLQRCQTAKDAFDRVDFEGVLAASDRGERRGSGYLSPQCEGTVLRGEAQLLLADAGEVMTKLRIEEELSLASWRARVLFQLVQERRKKNRLAHSQAVSRASTYDVERIYRSAFLSWFLSGRAKEDGISWVEEALIRVKTRLYRGLRTFSVVAGYPRKALENLAKQGLISSLLLAPLKESEARATFRLAVGDAEDDGTGFSVSFNFLHKGNASIENPVEALPPGVGLALTLDMEAKDGVSDCELDTAAETVGKVLRAHFLPELKRSALFHSMRAAVVKLPDKSQVVRVVLCWRAQANIDFVCRQLKLGLRPTDLVRELTVSVFCPLALSQILESGETVLKDSLKVCLSAEACFCGPLVSKLLEESLAGILETIHQAGADSSEHDRDRVERQERTTQTATDMEHPLVVPKRQVGGALSGVDGRPTGGKNGSENNTPWTKRVGGRRRTEREKSKHENARKMGWIDRMWSLAAKLRGTRAFALDLEAATPLEFLESSFARAYLPASWSSEEIFTTPGYAAQWFKSWKDSLLSQASVLAKNSREHAERTRLRQEAAQQKAVAVAETEEGKRLAGLEEELARLGVSRALLKETMGEKEEETARRLREARDQQMGEYADLEEALRACTRSLLGPREVRLQSGPNTFVVDMQGLDIFEALSIAANPAAEEA